MNIQKVPVNPDSFANAVVSSKSNLNLDEQLDCYIEAAKKAMKHNLSLN
ncbi:MULTISPECIES: hypothetical protein [Convivina]|uniref:Uncharacterized protein n=2 Tax=Convivina TaxID=1697027 RepID=A0A2U1D740_9LACO|nr:MULTISPECIES: hypothetical protein [Convivina]PVY83480.1 hypothetical protein C7384_10788 [Convivina intestini]CAH1856204.1 hypothetical protein R077815_01350 [Convivina sp. LMG 32447]CAH1857150.1 hypothetical protein LMG032447_01459 [Convivina sp. LMG 32447]SDC23294.1 hypothetical protein SAMN05216341_1264 [Leuconostocaceae bacterium R-53105]